MLDTKFFKDKKIFITGHTGFKGFWLTELLKLLGAKISGYSLNEKRLPYDLIKDGRVQEFRGDVRDLAGLKQAMKESSPELLIHMAAQPLVLESYSAPVYTYEVNVIGTVNLFEAARECESIRSILNVTTDKVYQERSGSPYLEDEKLCGTDPYSNSKSCSELVTYSYTRSFFQHRDCTISTARSGNVIGGGDFAKNRIVPDCFRAAKEGIPISVRNPQSIRPYQHVLEPLYGYLTILSKQYGDPKFAGSYNFGPEKSNWLTTGELAELFCNYWGEGCSWQAKPIAQPKEAEILTLNSQKAAEILGHKNRMDGATTVQKTVEWYKRYLRGKEVTKITQKQIEEYLSEF